MQINAIKNIIVKNNLKTIQYVDGDGIILEDTITNNQFEVRFYGIDAPELKICKKIIKDEKELHIPAQLLMKLGFLSLDFLKTQIGINESCTLIQEIKNTEDKYQRQLGYLILNDGRVLNQIMVENGFAKPYNDIFCEMLPTYQELNLQAKSSKTGLYSIVNNF
jgi:micrococcal nuclease